MKGATIEQVRQAVASVRARPGVSTREGLSAGDLAQLERQLNCYLPVAYRTLLSESNGIEVGYGFTRWLGYGSDAPLDVVWWNDPATWKWAYDEWFGDTLRRFLVLAIDADGHMTGCFKHDLEQALADPPFFGLSPIARPIAADVPLSSAIIRGMVDMAHDDQGDPLRRAILDRFGSVAADRLIVHSPLKFPHFTDDEEDLAGALVLPAAEAMIMKSDVWRDISRLDDGMEVVGVDLWKDEQLRQRLRLRTRRMS